MAERPDASGLVAPPDPDEVRRRTRDEHLFDPGPKRVLCLDGGGLRGSHALGVLQELETFLRERHGRGEDFRLADYFDLIAGTSTGAIIAAKLALGSSVAEVYRYYVDMGEEVFRPTLLGLVTLGLGRPRYERETLERYLKDAVGPDTVLGDPKLVTGLLVVAKRIDTHSVWPFANNPNDPYFHHEEGSNYLPNREYPLWQLLRASAAAPTYFDPVALRIADREAAFIDGGLSPYNDPSLQALFYVALRGFGLSWATDADRLLIVSVGTGAFEPPAGRVATGVVGSMKRAMSRLVQQGDTVRKAFLSLLHDNRELTKTLMQWMSSSPTATEVDSAMGDLSGDLLGGRKLFSFVRLDTELSPRGLQEAIGEDMDGWSIDYDSLERMDEPANVEFLFRIGRATGRKAVADPRLFPPRFDLGAGPLRVGLVGHRMNVLRTEHLEALTAEVRTVLHRVAAVVAERRRPLGGSPPEPHALVTVVTPLAEGADRIGARVATESGYGLACALPFVQEEYERDFASDASLAEFRALLEAADSWWELRGNRARRPEAYEAVGRAVLEHSDMLVAIWDGEPSRGRGGTADVVRAAAATMPVVWIHADPSRPTRVLTGLDGDALIQGAESEIGRLIAGLV